MGFPASACAERARTRSTAMTTKTSLPASIRSLVDKIEAARQLTPAETRGYLEEADISTADLEPWADFGHPAADSYGRRLVYDGGFFELMVMSWIDGDMAALHDHGYTQWGAVKLYGQIEHAVFKVKDGVLTTADRREIAAGSVIAVAHDLIHQMGNVGQEPYLTLHLYGCYGRDSGVTANAHLYELDEGKIQLTNGGVFFNLPESEIVDRRAAPPADFPTRLRFKVELLRRLMAQHGTLAAGSMESERERRLAGELFARETWKELADYASPTGSSTQLLYRELRATALCQRLLIEAGLAESPFDGERLSELLALDMLDRFGDGYLELVDDTYRLGLSSLAAA